MSEARALEEYYTYGDYKSWDDDLRWELIGGEVFCMSPGPGTAHQSLLMALSLELGIYFKNKECRPATARRDLVEKFDLYERAGVKEYVIADPHNRVVFAHRRDADGRFSVRKIYGADDVLEFGIFHDLKIPLSTAWGTFEPPYTERY